ncbi:Glyoxylase, beta-lactamase superfamily II [Dyadobacter soli]|uniref:Glyoxylase, beta-lactamase superfamily II n=1 Tax=Dyadobacter soli TaxID=659014 RepID=A0A1G7M881_9BACT|nr:MBL fold metallo-hydrolase [Dyadobacter soli]SDF57937.1 Glyoxylase, beta-lactamase superfamily II [Dyadobacter soli]
MKLEQIYTGCLAQGAYYIESDGEAAVIDPLRETGPYLARAEKNGAKIKYVLETHFHADFVSGHVDLAEKTGATIVYGPTANPGFSAHIAKDREVLRLGGISIEVIHTPGHTLESTCYLVTDENGRRVGLFTGDTLFIGDVGRPDLAQKIVRNLTRDKLAGMLYDSLHDKILPLPDDIIVYPAHGAGSACGKNMSKETTDSLGHQRATNYALQPMDKQTFIQKVTDGLTPPPAYFPANVMMNIQGYESIDQVLNRGMQALTAGAFEAVANETGALVVDTRAAQVFSKGFIPNSINIGIDGSFAPWVGALIGDIRQPILLVTEPGREEEVVMRLARVGYDNAIGHIAGGFQAWEQAGKEIDSIPSVEAAEIPALLHAHPDWQVLDVRKRSEYLAEHVEGAENLPLDYLNEHLEEIDSNKTYLVHCAGGYRSMIFNSILRARGYHNLIDVAGGFKAISESGRVKVTDYVCPTTQAAAIDNGAGSGQVLETLNGGMK